MSGTDFDDLVDFFDKMAQTKWLGAVHDQLKHLSGSWVDRVVLDIGCGTGRLLERGKGEATELIGIDLSPQMIEKSRLLLENAVARTKMLVGDAYKLPIAEKSVDVALSTCVMFLLPEPQRGIAEMIRVVKPNGTLVMLNPSPKMSPEMAATYADSFEMRGFERDSLLAWSNVSTKRHRYSNAELDHLLRELGTRHVHHTHVLDGLATITVALK